MSRPVNPYARVWKAWCRSGTVARSEEPGCATSRPRWRSGRPGTGRRSELVGSRRRQASDHGAGRSGALLGSGGLGRSGLTSSLIGLGSLTFSSRCGLWGRESYARAVRQVRRTQRSEPGPLDDPEGRPSRRHLGDVPAVITREHREASTRPDPGAAFAVIRQIGLIYVRRLEASGQIRVR